MAGPFGRFHVVVTVNSAAVNIGQIYLCAYMISRFSGVYPGEGWLEHTHSGTLLSIRKDEIAPLATTWRDRESSMPSAVSQSEQLRALGSHSRVGHKTETRGTQQCGGCQREGDAEKAS